MIYIYGLVDPRDNLIRYIGKTNNLKNRYKHELCSAKLDPQKFHRNSWIKGLLDINLKPEQFIIDIVEPNEWKFWEKHYISLYKSWGYNLTNHSNGGYGSDSVSAETKLKISNSLKGNTNKRGKTLNEEQRFNCGNGRRGTKQTDAHIKIVSKPVLQYTKTGEFIKEWPSGLAAAKALNIRQGNISNICNMKGYRKTANGFNFKYK